MKKINICPKCGLDLRNSGEGEVCSYCGASEDEMQEELDSKNSRRVEDLENQIFELESEVDTLVSKRDELESELNGVNEDITKYSNLQDKYEQELRRLKQK